MIIKNNDPRIESSFSLRNRVLRALWGIVWIMLFRTSPRPFHYWRGILLCCFGAKLGAHVHIYPGVRIWAPWNLIVGDKVGIGDGSIIYNMASIEIGDNCVISQGAHLCAGSHDIDSENFQLVTSPIKLDPYVWICADAFIGPGVNVAEGCVIGARCVVMRSIFENWTVWSGNPAVRVKNRKPAIRDCDFLLAK